MRGNLRLRCGRFKRGPVEVHCVRSHLVRGDIVKGTAEIFFRKAKFWNGGEPPPIFVILGRGLKFAVKSIVCPFSGLF